MFGKDRFQFESPNVVDPGEMPPSAPTRSGRSATVRNHAAANFPPPSTPRPLEHRIINTSMEYVDARDSATKFLQDVDVSPTRGAVPYAAETFHDEEEPLMEEDKGDAKLKIAPTHSVSFGRTIYDNPPSSNSSTSSFSLSQPSLRAQKLDGAAGWHRPSRRGRKLQIPSRGAHQQKAQGTLGYVESESGMSRKLLLFLCLAPLVLIVLVIVPLSHLIRQKNVSTDVYHFNGDPFLSERMLQAIDMLTNKGISDRAAISLEGTPQYLAALWMADRDPLQYAIPNTEVELGDSYYFVQRYVLVLLFHATGGNATWNNNLDFLSQHHECSWYHSKKFTDGEVYAMGASCRGEDLQVSDLLIRKYQVPMPNDCD
jgi:hypothetical protein